MKGRILRFLKSASVYELYMFGGELGDNENPKKATVGESGLLVCENCDY